jgi:hypothetical protein
LHLELKFRFSFVYILGRDAVIRSAVFAKCCAVLVRCAIFLIASPLLAVLLFGLPRMRLILKTFFDMGGPSR